MKTRVYRRIKKLRARRELKDRLIQTRVPGNLEGALKKEAKRRRLSVSHLIRNVLEDSFNLVDGVVSEVDNIVQGSAGLAERVGRDAGRLASHALRPMKKREKNADKAAADGDEPGVVTAGDESLDMESSPPNREASLEHILAWNKVVMNRDGQCVECGTALRKGGEAHLGISQNPSAPPVWICGECIAKL